MNHQDLAEGQADRWVCLVYHDVQPHVSTAGGGPTRFSVPLASFEQMLDTIAESGYMGCSVADALQSRGKRRVAIAFDDGDRGPYEYAVPALLARDMTATFYITTDWVGRPGYMSWPELREIAACGMSVQSHTVSHRFLSELDASGLRRELRDSKQLLDDELGQDTVEIAFPGGDPPASHLHHMIREAGYRTGVGTRWGYNVDGVDAGFVKRCTVRGDTTREMALRIIAADPSLEISRVTREAVLRRLRAVLGASRYTRWRRIVLDAFRAA